jgi:hypothetical protein
MSAFGQGFGCRPSRLEFSHPFKLDIQHLHVRLNLDTTLDDVDPLGPERFAVRAVNRAVNKVSEKNIDAIERAA